MTWQEILGLAIALLVMLVGMLGAIIPVLPGPILIFLAALVHRLCFGEHSVRWWVIAALGVMTLLVVFLDFLASTYGAKRFGATWKGMLGALIGGLLGLFWIPPFGILLGPLFGAAIAEWLGGQAWRQAGRAGVGAALGVLAGTIGKLVAVLSMILFWIIALLWSHEL